MKVSLPTKTLAAALQKLEPVFKTRTTLPVLSMVHLCAGEGFLQLSANNLEIFAETSVSAETNEPGECLVSGARLLLAAKTVAGDSITLDATGFLRAASGKQLARMGTLPVSELQAVHALNEVVAMVEIKDVGAIFARNLPFMSTDDARFNLCAQCVELADGRIHIIATDGRRLAVQTLDYDDYSKSVAIIPADTCSIIAKMEGDAILTFYANAVEVMNGDDRLISKLVAGVYAPWRDVIPEESSGATVSRAEMKRAVEVAATVGGDGTLQVKLDIGKDSIGVSARRAGENGDEMASDEVAAKVDIEPMEIAFSAAYLIDALDAIDAEETTMQLTSTINPLRIDHGSVTTVLMPMRVQ